MRSATVSRLLGRRRQRFNRSGLLDCLAAVVSAAVVFVGSASIPAPPSPFVRFLLGVAVSWPVALRRRQPVMLLGPMLLLVITSTVVVQGPMAWVFVPVAFVLYQVAATCDRRASLTAAAVTLMVLATQTLLWHLLGRGGGNVANACLLLIGAWGIGDAVRRHRVGAARDRERAADTAVVEERLRIARELHDMVAHSMTVIAVQAAYGHYVINTRPAQARTALSTIETTSRDVLAEMRHLVGVLRPVTDHAANGQPRSARTAEDSRAAPLAPTPGLGDLDQLVARTADAGVQVTVEVHGERAGLPPGIDLCAYRIVQEALANVVQHAGTDSCQVTLDRGHDELTIEITDHGRGHPDVLGTQATGEPSPMACAAGGHGLVGMRERVTLYGGQVAAGPLPDGGFQVTARIPRGDTTS